MPNDRNIDEEEAARDENDPSLSAVQGNRRRFKEFDCPECNANNPFDETFGNGDEITCNYCGQELKAVVADDGRLKLKLS